MPKNITPEAETIMFHARAKLDANFAYLNSSSDHYVHIKALMWIIQDANSIVILAKELLQDEVNQVQLIDRETS